MKYFYHRLTLALEFFVSGTFVALYVLLNKSSAIDRIGFLSRDVAQTLVESLVWGIPFVILFFIMAAYFYYSSIEALFRRNIFSVILIGPMFIVWGDLQFTFWLASVHLFSSILSLYELRSKEVRKPKKRLKKVAPKEPKKGFRLKPTQLVIISFVLLILVGSLVLALPISAAGGKEFSLVDIVFMATSATCVTGLATIPLDTHFSFIGQLVILLLIQIGGLGIMTLSSSMTLFLGRTLGMREQIMMQDLLDISSLEELLEMIIEIIKLTLVIELWGAVLLTVGFWMDGQEFSQAVYNGVFHSISAFCNAGFALFSNSLENYRGNYFVNFVVTTLIIMGGLGFIVLKELKFAFVNKRKFRDLSLHTRIVILTNLALLFVGTAYFFFSEFLNSIDSLPLPEKVLVSFFQSVTTRTAGFNTIGMGDLYPHTLYFFSLMMFVGASPGSTGGGIKTTTFAILIQSVKATLQGRKEVESFDRQIPGTLVVRATAMTIISLLVVSIFMLLVIRVESDKSFLSLFFEVVSAFGTVGLSTGITADLSVAGKILMIGLMVIGRVGPLTLALAVGQLKEIGGQIKYPTGRVMIG